jgi:hypothetical protein
VNRCRAKEFVGDTESILADPTQRRQPVGDLIIFALQIGLAEAQKNAADGTQQTGLAQSDAKAFAERYTWIANGGAKDEGDFYVPELGTVKIHGGTWYQ